MGQLRIIAGKWRGRKITFPNEAGLRPTLDRVRETVFNWLQPHIAGATCLDCFAGSGAFGLEALSRGAAHSVFIDQSTQAITHIKHTLKTLKVIEYRAICSSLPAGFQQLAGQCFDLVFLDPPYDSDMLAVCLKQLLAHQLIGQHSTIYIEASIQASIELPLNWQWLKQGTTASLQFGLLTHQQQPFL